MQVGPFTVGGEPDINAMSPSEHIGFAGQIRGRLKELFGMRTTKEAIEAGDQAVIRQIDDLIKRHEDIVSKIADIADLADHPGFIQLRDEHMARLAKDTERMPDQAIALVLRQDMTILPNAIVAKFLKKFFKTVSDAKSEKEALERRQAEELAA